MNAEEIRKIMTLLENTTTDGGRDEEREQLTYEACIPLYIAALGVTEDQMAQYLDAHADALECGESMEYLYNSSLTNEQLRQIAEEGHDLPPEMQADFPVEISMDDVFDCCEDGEDDQDF